MDWIWTWGGRCFGYRLGDGLFTQNGRQVGRFDGEDVYGADGRYLGELRGDRLITDTSRTDRRKEGFTPTQGGSFARMADYAGFVMVAGYEDFPAPSTFRA